MTAEQLLAFTRRLLAARTEDEVYEATVETAQHLLSADTCTIATARAEDDRLIERASTAGGLDDVASSLPMGQNFLGHACRIDHSCVIDDLLDVRSTSASTGQSSTPGTNQYRSLLAVPIRDVGVFVAAARTPDAFSEDDLTRIEQLLDCTVATVDDIRPHSIGDTDLDQIEEIASVLSHDLTNPLSVARGNLELAWETGDEQHFDRVEAAHDRIEDLVEDLVTLARTDRHIDEVTAVDLGEMANTAWTTVETPEATLEIEGTISLMADRSRLCQLLENLFSNAVAHGGSDVSVRVGRLDRGFYVEDDGRGFPDDDHDRLFEWGYSGAGRGTGLGLSIVKQVADAHGWDIRAVTSTSGGARFEVDAVEIAD